MKGLNCRLNPFEKPKPRWTFRLPCNGQELLVRFPSQNPSFFKTQVAPPFIELFECTAENCALYLPFAAPSGAALGTHPAVFNS
jgi:hypothetical protein